MNSRSRKGIGLLVIAGLAWLGQRWVEASTPDAGGGVFADALLVVELACVMAGLVILAWGIFGNDR